MTTGSRTIEDVKSAVKEALQHQDDLGWARVRSRVCGGGEGSAIFKLLVMPRVTWWSWLEQEALNRELIGATGTRWIDVEDERASGPGDFEEHLGCWQLLLDRDPARRLRYEHYRANEWQCIDQVHQRSRSAQDGFTLNLLGSPLYRKDCEDRFRRISDIVDLAELFGEIPDENEWGGVSNAAQEAARHALQIASDVWKMDGYLKPATIRHYFRYLVKKGLLEPGCASRLAAWIYPALHLCRSELSEERIRALLAISSADLAVLCDVPKKAVEAFGVADTQTDSTPSRRFASDTPGTDPPEHEVDDFFALTRVDPEPGRLDFFISYSWQRRTEEACELEKALTARGYRVFLDKNELREDMTMVELVPALVDAVRSSTAVIVFEVLLGAPIEALSEDREAEAITKGHAMRAPAVNDSLLVQWSWQTLELVAATHFLGVHEGTVFATAFQKEDTGFMTSGRFRTIHELADICEAYLDSRRRDRDDQPLGSLFSEWP